MRKVFILMFSIIFINCNGIKYNTPQKIINNIDEIVDVSFRGRIISYLTTFGYIGQFLSPLVFSPVVLLLGLNSVFLRSRRVLCCIVLDHIF